MKVFSRTYLRRFAVPLVVGIAVLTSSHSESKSFETARAMEIYAASYRIANEHYVDDVDPSALMKVGMDAMLKTLDPYTNYISATDIEAFRLKNQSNLADGGFEVKMHSDRLMITNIILDSPAKDVGLEIGDEIISIDGSKVAGRSADEVERIVKGSPGSAMNVVVKKMRTGQEEALQVLRQKVENPNVPYKGMVDKHTAYVKLTIFTQQAATNIAAAINELKKKNDVKFIILDLRDNGGGLLAEAVNICDLFIDKNQEVVNIISKTEKGDKSFGTRTGVMYDTPVAVLVNEKSASASEIVSGVIQDVDRGIVVGQQTFGKGLVQNTFDVGYKGKVKVTTARYYIPSGRCIQGFDYDNEGEAINLDESKRNAFKTANGRTVYDGGGVKPDIVLAKKSLSSVAEALLDNHLIFDYVNTFVIKNKNIQPAKEFEFNSYDQFVNFVSSSNFEYETNTGTTLKLLEKAMEKEEYTSSSQQEKLKAAYSAMKKNDLLRNKAEISSLIRDEIVNRYYGEAGKVAANLNADEYVSSAISIMQDESKYQTILNK